MWKRWTRVWLLAPLLFVSALLAWAATVRHEFATDWIAVDKGTPFSANIITTNDAIELGSITWSFDPAGGSATQYYRGFSYFNTIEWQFEANKDDATYFNYSDVNNTGASHSSIDNTWGDPCMPLANVPWTSGSDARWQAPSGSWYRVGTYVDPSGNESTLPDGVSGGGLFVFEGTPPDSTMRISEVRLLTTGTHTTSNTGTRDYKLTWQYSNVGARQIKATVTNDNRSAGQHDVGLCDGTQDWCLTNVAPELGRSTCPCDQNADSKDRCVLDEVRFFNPQPNQPLDDLLLNWDNRDEKSDRWLHGPIALSVVTAAEADYGLLFDYRGQFETGDTLLDAGANALWYVVRWDQALGTGQVRVSVSCSADGVTFANVADYGGPYIDTTTDGLQTFGVINTASTSPSQACAGRYAKYTIELMEEFDGLTPPKVNYIELDNVIDADGDGYGVAAIPVVAGVGNPAVAADCDDTNAAVNPGVTITAAMVGDGIDNDCSGGDECYADTDMDGFGTDVGTLIPDAGQPGCVRAEGESSGMTDCDDGDAAVHPGAQEQCDSLIDYDCDGTAGGGLSTNSWYPDSDADGYGDATATATTACNAPIGSVADNTDCDDAVPGVHPGAVLTAATVVDTVDDDCDTAIECWVDADGDGQGPSSARAYYSRVGPPVVVGDVVADDGDGVCTAASGESSNANDCDDAVATVFTGASVVAADVQDGIDRDCDGFDECFSDGDGDTQGTDLGTIIADDGDGVCTGMGESINADDCDDNAPLIFLGNLDPTAGDGVDDDCDGAGLDECFTDGDGDSWGTAVVLQDANSNLCIDVGEATQKLDCDDAVGSVHPNAIIVAGNVEDGVDQDCDTYDECFADVDGDGFGDGLAFVADSDGNGICANALLGQADNGLDCDDANPLIYPGITLTAVMVADGVDDDCDTKVECWKDVDLDGQGPATAALPGDVVADLDADNACTSAGESTNTDDCDDNAATVFLGATTGPTDVGDGVDRDCNGFDECFDDQDGDTYGTSVLVDDAGADGCADPTVNEAAVDGDCDDVDALEFPGQLWYPDADSDGYGDGTATPNACQRAQPGDVLDNTDCSDDLVNNGANIYPTRVIVGADINDGYDNDCQNGDECYTDSDQDTFGVLPIIDDSGTVGCLTSEREADNSSDCDDSNASITPTTPWYADTDGDGYGDPTNSMVACTQPSGFVLDNTDCDDTAAAYFIGESWYPDCDGDGVFIGTSTLSCGPPATLLACSGGTTTAAAWTATAPTVTDCNDSDVAVSQTESWYADCDGDGIAGTTTQVGLTLPVLSCGAPAVSPVAGETAASACLSGVDPLGSWVNLVPSTADCDDELVLEQVAQTWYPDCDADGVFTDAAVLGVAQATVSCGAPALAPGTHPATIYTPCVDSADPDGGWSMSPPTGGVADCAPDDAAHSVVEEWFADCDGDGRPSELPGGGGTMSCGQPTALVNPLPQGAQFTPCLDGLDPNGFDYDGNGVIDAGEGWQLVIVGNADCNDEDPIVQDSNPWYPDCDGDKQFSVIDVAACGRPPSTPCNDGAPPDGGWASVDDPPDPTAGEGPIPGEDCDDENPIVSQLGTWFSDCDGDGFQGATPINSCGVPTASPCIDQQTPNGGWTLAPDPNVDCDDEDATERPGVLWYRDTDGDSYGDPASERQCDRDNAFSDWLQDNTDCDDTDRDEHPGALWYPDGDGDTFGDIASPPVSCERGQATDVEDNTDCDDARAEVNPLAIEQPADNLDQNCDGTEVCFQDSDDDGHRPFNGALTVVSDDADCADAYEADALDPTDDCNDLDPFTFGGAGSVEIWYDGVDQNCDGADDFDQDGDGYRCDPSPTLGDSLCPDSSQPGRDCNDDPNAGGPARHPNTNLIPGDPRFIFESCETVSQDDDDCDGNVNTQDEGAGDLSYVRGDGYLTTNYTNGTPAGGGFPWFIDQDGDGEGASNSDRVYLCNKNDEPVPEVWSDNSNDCDDSNPGVASGAIERCNQADDNCNNPHQNPDAPDYWQRFRFIDEPQAGAEPAGCSWMYADVDGDGFGDQNAEAQQLCVCPAFFGAEYDIDGDGTPDRVNAGACPDGDIEYNNICWSLNNNDCDDVSSEIHPLDDSQELIEVIDGIDNDCDGFIPLMELDCDNDGSFPLLPIETALGQELLDPSDVGLFDCREWTEKPPTVRCFGGLNISVTCSPANGFWRVATESLVADGYFLGSKRVGQVVVGCNAGGWDCDDQCQLRCEGQAERCDGVDNDCNDARRLIRGVEDHNGVPDSMESRLQKPGYVVKEEMDLDGDQHITCSGSVGSSQTSLTGNGCSEITNYGDCNDQCVFSAPDRDSERCNGFVQPDTCIGEGEGVDGPDRDRHKTCGAWGDPEFIDLAPEEDVFLLVLAQGELDPDLVSPDQSNAAQIVPLLEPRPQAEVCDAYLAQRIDEIGATPRDGEDFWHAMLRTCIKADTCARIAAGGKGSWPVEEYDEDGEPINPCRGFKQTTCGVARITLSDNVDHLLYEQGVPGCLENLDQEWHPEQAITRTVWHRQRILDARRLVVEWECYRTRGTFGCALGADEIPEGWVSPYKHLQPIPGGYVDNGITGEVLRADPNWIKELTRFAPRPVIEGSVVGCWGDPANGVEGLRNFDFTGGDCDPTQVGASRDQVEGPGDLVGKFFGEEADCSLCLDGIDNNCNGLIDCADPACAECFVGQGVGCGGGCNADVKCTQSGCDQTGLFGLSNKVQGVAQLLLLMVFSLVRRKKRTDVV